MSASPPPRRPPSLRPRFDEKRCGSAPSSGTATRSGAPRPPASPPPARRSCPGAVTGRGIGIGGRIAERRGRLRRSDAEPSRPIRHLPASASTGAGDGRRHGGRTAAATLLVALAIPLAVSAAETYPVDPETGYRMERYRAPVPESVPGGVTLDTEALRARVADGTIVLVDVFPPKGLGADPLDGSWVVSEGHATLPGSIWLPEVGRGYLTAEHEAYFRRNLERLSGGDRATPMVFFCTADCWQSWNAAKRAAGWGYTGVHWYPLGTDGWAEEGGVLVPARPLNFLDDSPAEVAPGDAGAADGLEATGVDGSPGDASAPDAVATLAKESGKEASPAMAVTTTASEAGSVETEGGGPFPPSARIALVDGDGVELEIGTVRFDVRGGADPHAVAFDVTLEDEPFSDHFLSMRPFRCITGEPEWFCHLPYPYALGDTVGADDLIDLEYRLLFIVKSPGEFGIDAWNGVYYRLTPSPEGGFDGALLEGDLNVLAAPPEDPDARPIDLSEFIGEEAGARRFPRLVIRP